MDITMQALDYPQSPLLRLPLELRLQIYEQLLLPSLLPSSTHSLSPLNLLPDHHVYHSSTTNETPTTLSVRTIDPYLLPHSSRTWRRRSTYHIRTGTYNPILRLWIKNADREIGALGPFLTHTTPTTYRVLLSPYTAHLRHTVPSLLLLNRQIHDEAARVLYSTYTFNFHTSIESLVPFLSDLTPTARSAIRHVSVTKKPLPYTSEFDRAEWSSLCTYLSTTLHLRTLTLNIIAGKPGNEGWDDVLPISAAQFGMLRNVKKEFGSSQRGIGGVDLEWVEQVMMIKGLREVNVNAMVEHCPLPRSETMAFWVAFSKSIESGFAEWIRGAMVEAV
ncbi:hypothetical protein BDV96DRAFT_175509 [Lophiotrema nucula]|uniref:Uncharacterized protein n=1 Tax=Lophiotrema nucula TaxID=690887 RepID=A0A6A5YYN4_9PLEO|nr:hypothetical protein BDV96DRAFT_175509 [Lophiotrema nucula]